ncbi:MAG TPA: transaminase [Gemmatimonadales bacterium]|nr:transaminase [Gemmatimonadales bacterium]
MTTIERDILRARLNVELERFADTHPRSRALAEKAGNLLISGVPMPWMVRWAGAFPLFVQSGAGPNFVDVDGHRYIDFCLGDTGAMSGHAPGATVRAVEKQAIRGLTFMLPNEDAIWVADELRRRFGLPAWQFTLSATDANRAVIRLARQLTGRSKILVFNWCYHGTVDETLAVLDNGAVKPRPGNIGPPVDPALTTRVVEWNDAAALEAELAHGDVACVLAEPAMTNIGIIPAEAGFHAALRQLTRRSGTLLVLDETHTISAGPGGLTRAEGLEPDFLTIGKAIGGGVPGAAYGCTAELAARLAASLNVLEADTGGIGGTLAANALSLAAMRATLGSELSNESFGETIPMAARWTAGIRGVIAKFGLPWCVQRLGCRAEYWFRPSSPRNGGEAAQSVDPELERYMHLAALNRGVLLTPFHNMALIAPGVSVNDIDRHTAAFHESVAALVGS